MEYRKEKEFQSKATYDTFDEIYTNYDISVNETYDAGQGYPFDYPIRWLRDASMNKRIAVRRLVCVPSSHVFKLRMICSPSMSGGSVEKTTETAVTHADNLLKVISHLKNEFSFSNDLGEYTFFFYYDDNTLELGISDDQGIPQKFSILPPVEDESVRDTTQIESFLRFLNQPITDKNIKILTEMSTSKVFKGVWNRDDIFFHASFSTSKRKYIGISGDFYTNPTVLYPPPTNDSTFYIRTTTNGRKNILIRHSTFMIQLCFIVNFMKTKIL